MVTDHKTFKAGDRVFHIATAEEEGTVVGHQNGQTLVVFDDTPRDVESIITSSLREVKS